MEQTPNGSANKIAVTEVTTLLPSDPLKPADPGTFTVVWSGSPEEGESRLFDHVKFTLSNSDAEQVRVLVVNHGSLRALAAQRALAGVVTLQRAVALVQPSFPQSQAVAPFVRDYLTNSRAKKIDVLYIDGASIEFEKNDSLLNFCNEIKSLCKDLNIPALLFISQNDTADTVLKKKPL